MNNEECTSSNIENKINEFENDSEELNESEEVSESGSESVSEDYSESDSNMYSQQNLFYFQNMDQLLGNYFASDDVNVVNSIQNLDKSIQNFSKIFQESMEQNAKCILRVAKVLESASANLANPKPKTL
jgi:hypothetical protein